MNILTSFIERFTTEGRERKRLREALGDPACSDELCDKMNELDLLADSKELVRIVEEAKPNRILVDYYGEAEVQISLEYSPKHSVFEREGFCSIGIRIRPDSDDPAFNYVRFILITPLGVHIEDYDQEILPQHADLIDALDISMITRMIKENL